MSNLMISPWRGGTPDRLAKALDLRLVSLRRLQSRHLRTADVILNWGTSRVLDATTATVLNFPSRVARASNKLSCFRALEANHLPTLEWTTDQAEAIKWLPKASVIGHFDLHGHSGSGLRIYNKGTALEEPNLLYTKYFPKDVECRVHLIKQGDGKYASMYLEKKRRLKEGLTAMDLESADTYIRTWENGWIFAREVDLDAAAVEWGAKTVSALGLDYGAVDIMRKGTEYKIGEVNTAPGLEGQALDFYVKHLSTLIRKAS